MFKYLLFFFLGIYSFFSLGQNTPYKISILTQENEVFLHEIKQHTDFKEVSSLPINLGITTKIHWLKIEATGDLSQYDFMTIGEPITNNIHFNAKSLITEKWEIQTRGELHNHEDPPGHNTIPSFHLKNIDWNEPVYILIDSKNENLIIPIHFYTTANFYNSIIQRTSSHNFLYGFLILIVLLNSTWYLINRDSATAYFVINMFFLVLFIAYMDGYLQKNIQAGTPVLYNAIYYTISFAGTIAAFRFGQSYLKTKEFAPKIDKLANLGLLIVGTGYLLSWFSGNGQLFAQFLLFGNNIILTLVYIIGANQAKKKGYAPATFMLYAFVVTSIFSNLFILQNFGIIPANIFTQNGIHIGYSILGVSITIGLLVRYKLLIDQQKHNEVVQRIKLEKLVRSRTKELENTNKGLIQSNKLITEQKQKIDDLNYDLIEALKKINS
jgi:hypothetical protein